MLMYLPVCNSQNKQNIYQEEKQASKPNFIVIYTDDQRFDGIGVNNNEVIKTPNIDRMAKKGIQFKNANVAFSLCSPSRAALLTGRYGSSNGVLDLGSGFNIGEITLAQYLKKAGYVTALSGKWHIKQEPKSVGFDFYSYFIANGAYYNRKTINENDTIYPKEHVDLYSVKNSIKFLEQQHNSNKPFFLFHCPQTPHMNGNLVWDATDATKATYNVNEMPVPKNHKEILDSKPNYLKTVRNLKQAQKYGYPDSLAIQKHTRDYYAVISELDAYLGVLFDKIEKLGLMKNTYIVFMSDNGWQLGDHGFTSKVLPYEPSSHVPFWIVGPDILPKKNTSLVSNLDVLPTLLDKAKVDIPKNIHGKSLLPILNNEQEVVRDYFVYEGLGLYGGTKPNLTIITDSLRYIRTYEDRELNKINFEELYDYKNDPWEVTNFVKDESKKNIINKMDKRINRFKNRVLKDKK